MIEDHGIIIYVALIGLGMGNYTISEEDLTNITNLYNKRVRYDHYEENCRRSMIKDDRPYGLGTNKKPGIQTVSVNFIETRNEILKKQNGNWLNC